MQSLCKGLNYMLYVTVIWSSSRLYSAVLSAAFSWPSAATGG